MYFKAVSGLIIPFSAARDILYKRSAVKMVNTLIANINENTIIMSFVSFCPILPLVGTIPIILILKGKRPHILILPLSQAAKTFAESAKVPSQKHQNNCPAEDARFGDKLKTIVVRLV